jgi:hypothetical protein
MRTKKAIIHGRHSRKRNGRNIGNNYSNKRNSTPIKKRSIKNKVGGAFFGFKNPNCETSYKRFVNDKCFSLALTKQLDLAIGEFLVELSQQTIRTEEYADENKRKIYLFDTESRMLYNKIRERMFPFLLGIMKMREKGNLLKLQDFDGPYNFLISTIILSHIEKEHVASFVEEKVVSYADLIKEIKKTKKKTDDCFKSNKCIEIDSNIRTHILFPYLISGYNTKLFNALDVLRPEPRNGGSRVLVGGAAAAAARAAEAAGAAREGAEPAAPAEAEAEAAGAAAAAEAAAREAAREAARAGAGAEAARAEAEAAREGAGAGAEAARAEAEAAKAEAEAAREAAEAARVGAPAGAEAKNLKKINDKYSKIIRLLQIAGIEDEKYTTLLDKILSKLGVGVKDSIMTPYVLNQNLPFFGKVSSLSVFKICNQIFQIFIELETKNGVLDLDLDLFTPKELSHLEHLLCTGEMEDTHTEFDLPSRFYNVSSNTRESGQPVANAGPFSEPINFSWAQALIKKFKALVFLTTETEQKFYVKPKIFAFYKRESDNPVKDIDKYIKYEQYFGNVIPSLKISSFSKKPRLSMTSRIYVVNALSKLLYLMIDESKYYKHYEIFAKNITSLVELYKAYQKKSEDCNGIKIVVEQTPSTHSRNNDNVEAEREAERQAAAERKAAEAEAKREAKAEAEREAEEERVEAAAERKAEAERAEARAAAERKAEEERVEAAAEAAAKKAAAEAAAARAAAEAAAAEEEAKRKAEEERRAEAERRAEEERKAEAERRAEAEAAAKKAAAERAAEEAAATKIQAAYRAYKDRAEAAAEEAKRQATEKEATIKTHELHIASKKAIPEHDREMDDDVKTTICGHYTKMAEGKDSGCLSIDSPVYISVVMDGTKYYKSAVFESLCSAGEDEGEGEGEGVCNKNKASLIITDSTVIQVKTDKPGLVFTFNTGWVDFDAMNELVKKWKKQKEFPEFQKQIAGDNGPLDYSVDGGYTYNSKFAALASGS